MFGFIGALGLGVFLVGISISQVLLGWVTFGDFGLDVIGVAGLIAGVSGLLHVFESRNSRV